MNVEAEKSMKRSDRRNVFAMNSGAFMRNLLHSGAATAGLIITVFYMLLALLDVVYPGYLGVHNDSTMLSFLSGGITSAPPTPPVFNQGWWYYFGTTTSQIPIFPSMLAALRFDLGYALLIVLAGAGVGLVFGAASGYFGGRIDELMMRVTDIFLSVPLIPLAIAVTFFLGGTFSDMAYALVLVSWPSFARLARGETLHLRSQSFMEAAISAGSSRGRKVFVHVIPHVLSPIFVQASLGLGRIVLVFATLFFLGIVAGDPYMPELGQLLVMGEPWLVFGVWWPIVIPGIFLIVFIVGVNLFGDGMRDILDPKLRS